MNPRLSQQILSVMRLELRKSFFARRGLWVYLLAIAPVFLYMMNAVYVGRERARRVRISASHSVSAEALSKVAIPLSREQAKQLLGEPYDSRTFNFFGGGPQQRSQRTMDRYTDGASDVTLIFTDQQLQSVRRRPPPSLAQAKLTFAGTFDLYFLRLAIFFGCVGIFMNLFRGEMLDKSLHFYLLTPMPRGALLAGKYLTGLVATVTIFGISAVLQISAMLWQFDSATIHAYLQTGGWGNIGWYVAVTALACVGYGSIFLTAGLVFKNPIVPAAAVLIWESANLFVPTTLKKFSMIFYLQSLSPVQPPPDTNMSPIVALLVSAFEPVSKPTGVVVILAIAAAMLFAASRRASKLEINYSAD